MRFTLRRKIQMTVSGLMLATSLFVFVYFPLQQRAALLRSFQNEVQAFAETAGLGVSMGLKSGDLQSVQDVITYIKHDPRVRFFAVVSEGQTVAAYPENFEFKEAFAKTDSLVVKRAAVESPAVKGFVVVGCSTHEVESQAGAVATVGAVVTLTIFIIGLITSVLLARSLVRPIEALRDAAQRIGTGDLTVHLNEGTISRDETGELTKAFNAMTNDLRVSAEEITRQTQAAERAAHDADDARKVAEAQQEYLAHSVDTILQTVERFAEGDLTARIEIESDDAIGKLARGFNTAVGNVGAMMTNIVLSAEAAASAAEQITAASRQVAEGAQRQSDQAQGITRSMSEMTNTIADNARNAGKAADVAETNRRVAQSGSTIVSETVEKIREIAVVVKRSAETIEKLGTSSAEIGEIISVINEIADQTNLLALNAAIEAARAGDSGRGFAVVADEVRKLAERTTQATKKISTMIQTIQYETREAVRVMEQGQEQVSTGITLADEAGISLKRVATSSEETLSRISDIAAASEEQSAATGNINDGVAAIAEISAHSAAGVVQIAASAEDLSVLMADVRASMQRFRLRSAAFYPERLANGNNHHLQSAHETRQLPQANRP
jgi:methyl-accepting chemotaxis protein